MGLGLDRILMLRKGVPDIRLLRSREPGKIVLGLTVLVPKWRRMAAWGLIALLFAVFPANVYMAANPELFSDVPGWALWARLPFQLVFLYWVYTFARKR